MAIYEDIHEIDRIDEHVDDESVARWRQHRDAPPRPHTTPILVGALVVVIAGVFAIDALRGSSPEETPSGGAPITEPVTSVAETSPAAAAAAEEPAVDDAPVTDQIDVEGCVLDVTSVGQGSSGPNVECVQKALTAAGFYTGPVDGVFSPALTASATTFQQATGLYVDGVVGRRRHL